MCLTEKFFQRYRQAPMLPKKLVDFFAHQSDIQDIAVAEREVVLTYALKLLAESPQAKRFAFNGGTCIRKLWLGPTGRFSMDLDFTAREPLEPEAAILDLMELFNREFHGITLVMSNFNCNTPAANFFGDFRAR